jgi:methyl-accepting chemotaxis protein
MSGDLEKTGVRLVAEGADDFFGTLRSAAKAIQEFANTAGKQAGLTGFAQDIKTVSSALKSIGSESKSASTTVKKANEDVAKSAGEVATKVTAAASATQNAGSVGKAYQESRQSTSTFAISLGELGSKFCRQGKRSKSFLSGGAGGSGTAATDLG